MNPFYWRGTTNFGDYLNSWIWPRLIPSLLGADDNIRLIGIGSLLKGSLNYLEGSKVIFGTGSGYGSIPPQKDYQDWKFYFVRGPMTAACFEQDAAKGIVDGAWLMALLPEFEKFRGDKKGVAFIPHWNTSETGVWEKICHQAGMTYVDPQGDLMEILKTISASELVITESLHGAIMADLFRTPWIPVRLTPKFLPFKWVDWFQSIQLEPVMRDLPLSDLFEYFYNGASVRHRNYDPGPYPVTTSVTRPTEEETKPQGSFYQQTVNLKRKLRGARATAFQLGGGLRNVPGIRGWNERHQEKLVQCFAQVRESRPFLSRDQVRDEKIEQLAEVTDLLKKDYASGQLLNLNSSFS